MHDWQKRQMPWPCVPMTFAPHMFVKVGIYHIGRSAKHHLKTTLHCVPVRLYVIGARAGVWILEMATGWRWSDGNLTSSVADRPPTRLTIFPYLATTHIYFIVCWLILSFILVYISVSILRAVFAGGVGVWPLTRNGWPPCVVYKNSNGGSILIP